MRRTKSLSSLLPLVVLALVPSPLRGAAPTIHFDLPPIAAAHPISADVGDCETGVGLVGDSAVEGESAVEIECKLSSLISDPEVPRIDQWIVRCVPRDRDLRVVDYSPQTEVASDSVGPIVVKRSREETDHVGLTIDGAYGHLVRANGGTDRGRKETHVVEYQHQAPVQAVSAAGTIERGRGVYFKLRWSSQQVLEGEKSFRIIFRVPAQWRGGLLDVTVVAQSGRKTFAGFGNETETLGQRRFTVAMYRSGDDEAQQRAYELAASEDRLRQVARRHAVRPAAPPLAGWVFQLASTLDLSARTPANDWLEELIVDGIDPHVDERIRRLPMPIRVAALDYREAKEAFVRTCRTAIPSEAVDRRESIDPRKTVDQQEVAG